MVETLESEERVQLVEMAERGRNASSVVRILWIYPLIACTNYISHYGYVYHISHFLDF